MVHSYRHCYFEFVQCNGTYQETSKNAFSLSLLATELSVALLSEKKYRSGLSLFMQDAFKMSQL